MAGDTDFRNTVTSRALALIRWPLIMCIVAVHVFAPVDVSVGAAVYSPESSWLNMALWRVVKGFLSENGVATFFFISGYLFMIGPEMTPVRYRDKVRRRVHSLLVPYMIWNLIALVYVALLGTESWTQMTSTVIAGGFVMKGWSGYPHDAPMWFIRDLMVCIAVLPAFGLLLWSWGRWIVVLLGAICFYLYTQPSSYPLLICSAMFFFYWGAYMAVSGRDPGHRFRRFFVPCLVLYPLLGALFVVIEPYSYAGAMVMKCLNLLVVIPLAVNVACWFARRGYRANRFLTSATFFVFASHYIILGHFRKVVMALFRPQGEWELILSVVGCYVLLLGVLLGVYYLLTRISPAISRLLTGKR